MGALETAPVFNTANPVVTDKKQRGLVLKAQYVKDQSQLNLLCHTAVITFSCRF